MMDNDLIERLAREAGFDAWLPHDLDGKSDLDRVAVVGEYPCGELLARFAALVAEECAKVAAAQHDGCDAGAAAIRAKFKATPPATGEQAASLSPEAQRMFEVGRQRHVPKPRPGPPPPPPAVPTEEGLKRYPPDGHYDGEACTCKPTCESPCDGRCGCSACAAGYSDFLSSQDE